MLAHAQEKPQYLDLDYSRNRQADYESITAPELSALAAKYLAPDRAARFIVRPAEAAAPE